MENEKFSFESDIDGLTIHGMIIKPEGIPKGIVQIVHGMCEHKERYYDFMEYLASSGFITVIHDNRGHGESVESPEDLGYFYEGGAAGLVSDIYKTTCYIKNYVKERYGKDKLPYTLIGHSMGSLAVRCYVKKYDDEIDKLIVMGCPSKLSGMEPGLKLVEFLESKKGGRSRSKLIDFIVFSSNYEKRFGKEGPRAWVNSDKEKVKEYLADPLCNFTFTLNGYENLIRLTKETYSKSGYGMKNRDLYIRFVSGEDDPCAVSKRKLWDAMLCMKRAGYKNVRGRMYRGMRHEILNEPGHMKVYKDILKMINEQ